MICLRAIASARETGNRATEGNIQKKGLDRARVARVQILVAEREALRRQADYPGAIAKYEAIRVEGRQITDARMGQEVESAALGTCFGNAYRSLEQHAKAIEHLTQATAIAREIGNRALEKAIQRNLDRARAGRAVQLIEEGNMALVSLGDQRGALAKCEAARAEGRKIADKETAQMVESAVKKYIASVGDKASLARRFRMIGRRQPINSKWWRRRRRRR